MNAPACARVSTGLLLLAVLLLMAGATRATDAIGRLIIAKGVISAIAADGQTRLLDKGSEVFARDRIATADKSFAVIRLNDQTKVTLRPKTELALDEFSEVPGAEKADFKLLKGGLRMITGLVGAREPDVVRVNTPTASIGIRGTDLVARLCTETDCAEEEAQYRDEDYVQTTCPFELQGVPAGDYFAVFEGGIFAIKPPMRIDLDAVGAGYSNDEVLECLSRVPKFLVQDPYLRLAPLDDGVLELINFFNEDNPDDLECRVPSG